MERTWIFEGPEDLLLVSMEADPDSVAEFLLRKEQGLAGWWDIIAAVVGTYGGKVVEKINKNPQTKAAYDAVRKFIAAMKKGNLFPCVREGTCLWIVDGLNEGGLIRHAARGEAECSGRTVLAAAQVPGWTATAGCIPVVGSGGGVVIGAGTNALVISPTMIAVGGGVVGLFLLAMMARR